MERMVMELSKIKILSIFGTRPEAVKMAPLVKELQGRKEIESIVCVTAQHREMLDQVLEVFNISPDYDLNVMKERQSLSGITSRVLQGLEEVLVNVKPDMILVHGDTTTTFAGSLAAYYNKIQIGHVEAGLRTFDKYFPFPEEINRKLTGVMADVHFAPTQNSKRNLLNEGIKEEDIFITGNTAIDAMTLTVNRNYKFETPELNNIDFKNKKVIMVTAHRRENWGEPLNNICKALGKLADRYEDVEIVYLLHMNPVVRETAFDILGNTDRVHLLPALNIMEAHNLMDRSYMVLTDSGGIQEEGPHLGKPVLVMRDVTERPEAVAAGTVKVVGTDMDNMFNAACSLIEDKALYASMANATNPYGDGSASRRIADGILYHFGRLGGRPVDFEPVR